MVPEYNMGSLIVNDKITFFGTSVLIHILNNSQEESLDGSNKPETIELLKRVQELLEIRIKQISTHCPDRF